MRLEACRQFHVTAKNAACAYSSLEAYTLNPKIMPNNIKPVPDYLNLALHISPLVATPWQA